jgi:orotate phosphoribosyltransferase
MNKNQILKELEKYGVILTGHFVGTKGGHMSKYVNKDAITENPKLLNKLANLLAQKANHIKADVVVSPAMGAIILGQSVAYYMNIKKSIFCEKDNSATYGFTFKRGYDKHLKGKKIIVVEDIFNTKGSAKDTIETVKAYGGNVVAIACLLDRNNPNAVELGIEEIALLTGKPGEYELYSAEDCQLCKAGIPVNTEVGHGAKFLAEQKAKQ